MELIQGQTVGNVISFEGNLWKTAQHHPFGTMNVCKKCLSKPSNIVEVFQPGPKWWSDIAIHRAIQKNPTTTLKVNIILETVTHQGTKLFYNRKTLKVTCSEWELVPSIQLYF